MILGFPRAKQGLCHTKHGGEGYHFVSIAYSISSFFRIWDELTNINKISKNPTVFYCQYYAKQKKRNYLKPLSLSCKYSGRYKFSEGSVLRRVQGGISNLDYME